VGLWRAATAIVISTILPVEATPAAQRAIWRNRQMPTTRKVKRTLPRPRSLHGEDVRRIIDPIEDSEDASLRHPPQWNLIPADAT
jgi:hypothetical protein